MDAVYSKYTLYSLIHTYIHTYIYILKLSISYYSTYKTILKMESPRLLCACTRTYINKYIHTYWHAYIHINIWNTNRDLFKNELKSSVDNFTLSGNTSGYKTIIEMPAISNCTYYLRLLRIQSDYIYILHPKEDMIAWK